MITAAIIAALVQSAAINSQRDEYLACLKSGLESAKLRPERQAIESFLNRR